METPDKPAFYLQFTTLVFLLMMMMPVFGTRSYTRSAVVFIFIVSWLLTLLTIVIFIVAATLENFACQPAMDPNLTFIKRVKS